MVGVVVLLEGLLPAAAAAAAAVGSAMLCLRRAPVLVKGCVVLCDEWDQRVLVTLIKAKRGHG